MNWQESRKKEIEKLFECVESILKVSKAQLLSSSRKENLVVARKMFMNVLFELFEKDKMNHVDITSLIKRKRCTFIHHRNGHLDCYKRYKNYKENYDYFKSEYQAKIK